MDASQAECSSHGALNNVWKHFNANRELHQARSGESSQRTVTKPFRSVTQHPSTLQDDSTFNEFFSPLQNEPPPPLANPLLFTMDTPPPPLQVNAPDPWAWEFNNNNGEDGNEQHLQDAWHYHSSHVIPATPLEHAYAQHFTSPQNSTKMSHVMDEQWERQFAAISIDSPSIPKQASLHSPMQHHVEPFISRQQLPIPSAISRTSFAPETSTTSTTTTTISTPDEENFDDWTNESDLPNKQGHEAIYEPDLGDYTFASANPYLDEKDAINLPTSFDAILSLEATIRQDPDNSNDAWMQLAQLHVQNDNHRAAAQALRRTRHDPPHHTMMQLALCYSSLELYPAAYYALQQWISQTYPDLVSTNGQLPNDPCMLHRRVMDSFLAAATSNPEADTMDPDVQVGLAILSGASGEYHRAADCFRAALRMRPKDAVLWNRLGITLANDGKAEEAIDAYSHALELDPSYVSARYHLSRSCITLRCYKEAAEHVLPALALYSHQPSKDDVTATALWDTLEKALKMMGMRDLARQAKVGNDVKVFQKMFE